MKEYNVILKRDIDYDSFWNDIESDTDGGNLYIPNRAVQYTNERPTSLRQCWYLLTDEEAETLRGDERVLCVEIPPEHRDDIVIVRNAVQYGDFTKTTSDSGNYQNWGLIRCNNLTNNYGSGTTTTQSYNYTLDGTGVDVVIQDSGIQVDHPEFNDTNGNSRIQQINWFTTSGVSGTQSGNHYRDYDGHGTHVASTAAGLNYGWAKNARIYSQKLSGLEGTGDSGTGISSTYAFDCIKGWHNNKPIDPKTGVKRPTVVNMSWGYLATYSSVSSVTYRGVVYNGTDIDTESERNDNFGILTQYYQLSPSVVYMANAKIASVDTDIEEMINAGIVVCVAAGNRSFKIDVPDGTDWYNWMNTNNGGIWYSCGSSPQGGATGANNIYQGGPFAIIVGNMDSTSYSATQDQKATSSETGPGVTIYAPGTNIMGACSTTNDFTDEPYYRNTSYRQMNISGTSMASPQVAGVCALLFQLNPKMTPAQIKASLLANAGTVLYDTGTNNDWTNNRSLKGGTAKILYNKFNSDKTFSMGGVKFSGGISFRLA
jgi:subtilisin family serine protease